MRRDVIAIGFVPLERHIYIVYTIDGELQPDQTPVLSGFPKSGDRE